VSLWKGLRITLSCAHMNLVDRPRQGNWRLYVIGAPAACYVCPARDRVGGGKVAATRIIVDVAEVSSVRRPESLEPIHWYWEGQGY
jgi:hypothetical protein